MFSKLIEKALDFFFSAIGFRDPLIDNDNAVLPYIEEVLRGTPFADLEIGEKVPGRNYEHAIRFLGEDHVVKFVEPVRADVMRVWVENLHRQKTILERYLPHNLPSFSYFYVPVDNGQGECATYVLLMERVEGRPLYALSDKEIFSNRNLVENLVDFLDRNRELRREQGVFADLIGGQPHRILDPRYTGNLYVTKENTVKLVDTVLIPLSFVSGVMPEKYRLARLYHFCYRNFVLRWENLFYRKLQQSL